MCWQMLLLKCMTIFFVMWSIVCDEFSKLLIEDKNEYSNSTVMSINFIMQNISATDIRVVGTESFFIHNYTSLTMKLRSGSSHVSFTLLNIERQFHVTRKFPITAVVILFLDKYFNQFLNNLTKLWYRMKRNKVIAVANNCMEFNVIAELFALIWSKNVINFIYLHNCNSTVDVYTYFPFKNNQCRIFIATNIIKLGQFSTDTLLKKFQFQLEHIYSTHELSANTLPFFPDKVPLNLNRCPVKISTGIWPPNVINISSVDEAGIEVEFIKTIEFKLNCNITIQIDEAQDMGLKFGDDEEPTGRMGLLKNEKYDLLFGAVPATPNVFKDFDTSDCFLPNQLKFIVPTAGILPSSRILWTVIEKHTQLFGVIVVIVLLLSIIIKYMIKLSHKLHPPTKNYRLFIWEIFVTLLRSLIETSTPILPDSKIIQWVYGIWFGSCLIISCYFTTTLTSFFAEPGYVKQIRTVQDIIGSRIPISIDELYYPIFTTDPEQIKYFRSRNVKATVPIGLKLASTGDAATFTDVLRARHISVQWVSSYGDSSIYYVGGNKILSYWNVMITYKGNPLLERINDIMRRINQSGFWNFQVEKYYNRRLIRTMVRQYLIVYNFQNGINNTKSINQFNEGFSDSLPIVSNENGTEKLLLETNEKDIIKRFARSDKTLITWGHLSTVFQFWAIGMAAGGLVFLSELIMFQFSNFINISHPLNS